MTNSNPRSLRYAVRLAREFDVLVCQAAQWRMLEIGVVDSRGSLVLEDRG